MIAVRKRFAHGNGVKGPYRGSFLRTLNKRAQRKCANMLSATILQPNNPVRVLQYAPAVVAAADQ